jgi:hypothetical protein
MLHSQRATTGARSRTPIVTPQIEAGRAGRIGSLRMASRKSLRDVQRTRDPRRIATAPRGPYPWAGARLRPRPPNAKTRPIRIMDVSGPGQTPAGLGAGTPVADPAKPRQRRRRHQPQPVEAPVCAARPASGRCPRRRGAGPSTRGMAVRCWACVRGRRPVVAHRRQERSERRTGQPHRRTARRPQP